MVAHTGTTARPAHLRSLNVPRALQVVVEHGLPVALLEQNNRQSIVSIADSWIINDEWWRQPIHRQYFAILLGNGQTRTIYHDRVADTWFAQLY